LSKPIKTRVLVGGYIVELTCGLRNFGLLWCGTTCVRGYPKS